jgi:protein TonB
MIRPRERRERFALWAAASLAVHGVVLTAVPVSLAGAPACPSGLVVSLEAPALVVDVAGKAPRARPDALAGPPRLETTRESVNREVPSAPPELPETAPAETAALADVPGMEETAAEREPAAPETVGPGTWAEAWEHGNGTGPTGMLEGMCEAGAELLPGDAMGSGGPETGAGEGAGDAPSAGVTLVRPIGRDLERPAYPEEARRRGEEGEVRLRLLVGEGGQVEQVELEESSGYECLDRAALERAREWRFRPARRGGREIAAWVEMPVVFRLDEEP